MTRCYKIIGSGMGYNIKCGGLWMGNVEQCQNCKTKDLKTENARLQNELLKKQLKALDESTE